MTLIKRFSTEPIRGLISLSETSWIEPSLPRHDTINQPHSFLLPATSYKQLTASTFLKWIQCACLPLKGLLFDRGRRQHVTSHSRIQPTMTAKKGRNGPRSGGFHVKSGCATCKYVMIGSGSFIRSKSLTLTSDPCTILEYTRPIDVASRPCYP